MFPSKASLPFWATRLLQFIGKMHASRWYCLSRLVGILTVLNACGCNLNSEWAAVRRDDAGGATVAADDPKLAASSDVSELLSIEPINEDCDKVKVVARLGESKGVPPESVLSLRLATGDGTKANPILGTYETDGELLLFQPAFPLIAGKEYVATLSLPTGESTSVTYQVPLRNRPAPTIVAMYPEGDVLPANHLKFYIQFSEPMQRGEIFQYFRLENVTKRSDVPRPFRHTELWSADLKQLTLWFHPGRQKTGVNLNVEIGAVLTEGDQYRLIVSKEFPSSSGVKMNDDFSKTFRAGPADHTQPDYKIWQLVTPRAETKDPFVCNLNEPLDWALLYSQLHLQDAYGNKIDGTATVENNDSRWRFVPDNPWREGRYRLAIGSVLEDLAGNSVERPFEVDVNSVPIKTVASTVYRTFDVKPK